MSTIYWSSGGSDCNSVMYDWKHYLHCVSSGHKSTWAKVMLKLNPNVTFCGFHNITWFKCGVIFQRIPFTLFLYDKNILSMHLSQLVNNIMTAYIDLKFVLKEKVFQAVNFPSWSNNTAPPELRWPDNEDGSITLSSCISCFQCVKSNMHNTIFDYNHLVLIGQSKIIPLK